MSLFRIREDRIDRKDTAMSDRVHEILTEATTTKSFAEPHNKDEVNSDRLDMLNTQPCPSPNTPKNAFTSHGEVQVEAESPAELQVDSASETTDESDHSEETPPCEDMTQMTLNASTVDADNPTTKSPEGSDVEAFEETQSVVVPEECFSDIGDKFYTLFTGDHEETPSEPSAPSPRTRKLSFFGNLMGGNKDKEDSELAKGRQRRAMSYHG
jgi:hypothetical protein